MAAIIKDSPADETHVYVTYGATYADGRAPADGLPSLPPELIGRLLWSITTPLYPRYDWMVYAVFSGTLTPAEIEAIRTSPGINHVDANFHPRFDQISGDFIARGYSAERLEQLGVVMVAAHAVSVASIVTFDAMTDGYEALPGRLQNRMVLCQQMWRSPSDADDRWEGVFRYVWTFIDPITSEDLDAIRSAMWCSNLQVFEPEYTGHYIARNSDPAFAARVREVSRAFTDALPRLAAA